MDVRERRRRASEEAADWWLVLRERHVSRGAREEFVAWLQESPVHVAEMLRIAQVHNELEHFEGWAEIRSDGVAARESDICPFPRRESDSDGESAEFTARRARWTWRGLSALAAGLLLVSCLAWFFGAAPRAGIIQTSLGERREVHLTDGSVVDVDPQSRLRVRLEEGVRRISLEEGRALFHVARNPNRPFLVQVDDTLVRAIGTAFGVERRNEGIVVTVAEGKVAILRGAAGRSSDPVPRRSVGLNKNHDTVQEPSGAQSPEIVGAAVFLVADQQATVSSSGDTPLVRKVNSGRELAWAEGHLVFDSNPVADVIEQFNRYNRIQLHVSDPALAGRSVSGIFEASDPESFVAFLQTVSAVRVTRSGQDISLVYDPRADVPSTTNE